MEAAGVLLHRADLLEGDVRRGERRRELVAMRVTSVMQEHPRRVRVQGFELHRLLRLEVEHQGPRVVERRLERDRMMPEHERR